MIVDRVAPGGRPVAPCASGSTSSRRAAKRTVRGVIGYPTNRLLAVIDDPALEARVRSELVAIGVPDEQIHVLSGDEAARAFDAWGQRSGVSGRLYRWVQFMAMDQTPDFERYAHEAQAGHAIFAIAASDGGLRRRIVEVLKSLGARFVNYYGRLEQEELIP